MQNPKTFKLNKNQCIIISDEKFRHGTLISEKSQLENRTKSVSEKGFTGFLTSYFLKKK